MTPIQIGRKESHLASKRTVQKRTKSSKEISSLMTGQSKEALSHQTISMVNSLEEEERKNIIDSMKSLVVVPPDHVTVLSPI